MTWRTSSTLLVALILKCQKPAKTPLSVRKVCQVIPGGQQEERFWVVHHFQGEHYQTFKESDLLLVVPELYPEHKRSPKSINDN